MASRQQAGRCSGHGTQPVDLLFTASLILCKYDTVCNHGSFTADPLRDVSSRTLVSTLCSRTKDHKATSLTRVWACGGQRKFVP